MLYKYFTEKLLGLQDVDIEKVEEIDNSIHINCRLKRKPHKCPCCGKLTDRVHDYREQPIKDIPAFGKHIFIHLNKRRYRCSCGKRFRNRILHMFSHQMKKRLYTKCWGKERAYKINLK
ncbi:transposase family protein, partial [Ruminococcus sp.]